MTKILFVVLMSLVFGGCVDNGTSVADRVAEAANRLRSTETESTYTASYEPGSTGAYTVVFFPPRGATEAEVVAAGVDKEVASRIYGHLAYLGSMANLLVVDQDGKRLTFTTYWTRFAEVRELVASPRKSGPAAIELRREDGAIRVVAVR